MNIILLCDNFNNNEVVAVIVTGNTREEVQRIIDEAMENSPDPYSSDAITEVLTFHGCLVSWNVDKVFY